MYKLHKVYSRPKYMYKLHKIVCKEKNVQQHFLLIFVFCPAKRAFWQVIYIIHSFTSCFGLAHREIVEWLMRYLDVGGRVGNKEDFTYICDIMKWNISITSWCQLMKWNKYVKSQREICMWNTINASHLTTQMWNHDVKSQSQITM